LATKTTYGKRLANVYGKGISKSKRQERLLQNYKHQNILYVIKTTRLWHWTNESVFIWKKTATVE